MADRELWIRGRDADTWSVIPTSVRDALRRRLPVTSLLLLCAAATLTACGSATSSDTTPAAPAAQPASAPVIPAQVKRCSELLRLGVDDRRSTLQDLRFDSGLQAYTDRELLAACKAHGTADLAAEARKLDAAAKKRERVRAAAKAKARKAKAAADAVRQAANRKRYTTANRDAFVQSCVATGGTVTRCGCLYRQFTLHVPYDQFIRDDRAILDGRMKSSELLTKYGDLIARCASY
jgi:hypothetical protein